MKNLVKVIFTLSLVITLSIALATAVVADSSEILKDPGFEEGSEEVWQGYSGSSLSVDDAIKHSGKSSIYCEGRKSKNDTPLQLVTEDIAFYGEGEYKVSAWVYMDEADASLQIAMMAEGIDGRKWSVTPYVTVAKKQWVRLEGTLNVAFGSANDLVKAEFYFNFNDTDANKLQSFYVDDCSLIKIGNVPVKPTTPPTPLPTQIPTVSPIPTPTQIPTEKPAATASPTPAPTAKSTVTKKTNDLWVWPAAVVIAIGGAAGGYLLATKGFRKKPKSDTP